MSLSTPLAGLHLRRGVVGTAAVFLWFYATTVLAAGNGADAQLHLAALPCAARHRSGHALAAGASTGRWWPPLASASSACSSCCSRTSRPIRRSAQRPACSPACCRRLHTGRCKELGERGEPEWRVVFYFSLTGVLLGGLGSVALGFTEHTSGGALLLLFIGISTLLAQLAMTRAYGQGRTETARACSFPRSCSRRSSASCCSTTGSR